jgi:hypothetical protein
MTSKLNLLMCEHKSTIQSYLSIVSYHRWHGKQASAQCALVPTGTSDLNISFPQGEYTTGWTGSGASKSDKKVCIQHSMSLELLTVVRK